MRQRLLAASLLAWFLAAAATALADFDDAELAYERGDYAAAMRQAAPLAERGSSLAQNLLGRMYEEGRGAARDPARAAQWYAKAAKQGNVMAQTNLARLLLDAGGGGASQAVTWLKKAVATNYPPALTLLGLALAEGRGTARDPARAEKCLRSASEYGYAPAQALYAELSLKGALGRSDPEKVYFYALTAQKDASLDPQTRRDVQKYAQSAQRALSQARRTAVEAKAAGWRPKAWVGREAPPERRRPGGKATEGMASTGTGFLVSRQGHLVTNNHVVERCASIKTVYRGREYDLRLLRNDPAKDLALLDLGVTVPSALALRTKPAAPGEGVTVVGFPEGRAWRDEVKVTAGQVRELASSERAPGRTPITAVVRPGNSGGPLLDGSGNVIGVVTAMRDVDRVAAVTGDRPADLGQAVEGGTLAGFLDANHVPYAKAKTYGAARPEAVATKARGMIMPIFCFR